jgi:hypothetical protein
MEMSEFAAIELNKEARSHGVISAFFSPSFIFTHSLIKLAGADMSKASAELQSRHEKRLSFSAKESLLNMKK